MTKFVLIAAVSHNNCVGINGQLPWYIPEDLKYFKSVTMGHTIVMGRKTADSIAYRLPGRDLIVMTEQTVLPNNVSIAHNKTDVFELTKNKEVVFIAGGANVYRQFINDCDTALITRISKKYEGDTYMSELSHTNLTMEYKFKLHNIEGFNCYPPGETPITHFHVEYRK